MKGIKVAGLIALAHLSKLVVNLFIMKQIAVVYGPDGLGFLGNFMSLITVASTLAGGGIISGVIKYVSQYAATQERKIDFLSSAFIYTLISAIIALILGMLWINRFTEYVFMNKEFTAFIYFFLVVQVFIAINNFAFGVCNGLRNTSVYASFTMSGNFIALIIAYYFIPAYGYWGAVISIAAPSVTAFLPLILYIAIKKIPLRDYCRFHSFAQDSRLLSKYSLMLLCSAICFPIVEMYVRNMIVNLINLEAAGYWQAITRLSSAYLSFYSLFLSFYFTPLISAETDNKFILEHVKKMVFLLSMLFIPMLLIFISFKFYLIQYIFSVDFLPIADLFILHMVGDFFRVMGWVIGFVVVAKALTHLYIFSEITQAVLFISLSFIQLIYRPELQNVVLAYTSTCILYSVFSFISFYFVVCRKK